jgi:hypothetical protein
MIEIGDIVRAQATFLGYADCFAFLGLCCCVLWASWPCFGKAPRRAVGRTDPGSDGLVRFAPGLPRKTAEIPESPAPVGPTLGRYIRAPHVRMTRSNLRHVAPHTIYLPGKC